MSRPTLAAICARLRKDAELMRVIHISDEEALAIADAMAPLPKKPAKAEPKVCGHYIPGHHSGRCNLPYGHTGFCEE